MGLVAATNWTAIVTGLTTGFTAIAVALVGIFSARVAARVGLRQAAAETERLHIQLQEERRRERIVAFQDFLELERQTRLQTAAGEPLTLRDYGQLLASMHKLGDTVRLISPREVARRAEEMIGVVVATVNDSLDAVNGGTEFARAIADSHLRHQREQLQARRALLDAMRQDVAADNTALGEWPERWVV